MQYACMHSHTVSHTHKKTNAHVQPNTYIYTYIHPCTHTHTNKYIRTTKHMHIRMHEDDFLSHIMGAGKFVKGYMYVLSYTCMCSHIHVCTFTSTMTVLFSPLTQTSSRNVWTKMHRFEVCSQRYRTRTHKYSFFTLKKRTVIMQVRACIRTKPPRHSIEQYLTTMYVCIDVSVYVYIPVLLLTLDWAIPHKLATATTKKGHNTPKTCLHTYIHTCIYTYTHM